ncbi:hypothetical protein HDE_00578 [Halotydeus destructor]|nr:hypothetical protein HDE_00578 [Halotydeus destructor]
MSRLTRIVSLATAVIIFLSLVMSIVAGIVGFGVMSHRAKESEDEFQNKRRLRTLLVILVILVSLLDLAGVAFAVKRTFAGVVTYGALMTILCMVSFFGHKSPVVIVWMLVNVFGIGISYVLAFLIWFDASRYAS